jgi:hypothetical protein
LNRISDEIRRQASRSEESWQCCDDDEQRSMTTKDAELAEGIVDTQS